MTERVLLRPRGARAVLVLAHGAGAGMRHPFMEALANALAEQQLATLRFEFPYMTEGRKRVDPASVAERTIVETVAVAKKLRLPMLAGGKSFGGRMTSMAAANGALPSVRGLVFFGYPLHLAKKPATKRAEHLPRVPQPMLFLQGTRDELAELTLLRPIVKKLPRATLTIIEGADHGFAVLKRSGRTHDDVLRELAAATAAFAARL